MLITLLLAHATANLDAPLNNRPTLRSELNRGHEAAFNCSLKYNADLEAFDGCVGDAINRNAQESNNPTPFMVGAYWEECQDMALTAQIARPQAPTSPYEADKLAEAQHFLALTYPVFRNYQHKLGLTDAQLVAALEDLTPKGKAMLAAELADWKKAPPQQP